MKKTAFVSLALACVISTAALGQEAPAPRRMPRTPVSSQPLVEPRDPMPASRQVQGPAAIIDGEKLRIGETDMRLFGIVPPQLAASFGPQARSTLDMLANGQPVTCQIRDRDRDGRLLATCRNAKDMDMGLELLKRGLAVTARGSIAGTELASSYMAAEQAAQSQKIGLWSMSAPAATAVLAPATVAAAKPEAAATAKAEAAKAETAKAEAADVAPRTDKLAANAAQVSETQAKIAADLTQNAQNQSRLDDEAWQESDGAGFFERYQILIAGFLMLATAVSIIGALWAQKRRDKIDEVKAVAAALRGELMAARSICYGRIKSITSEEEDNAATWPRIRATLYQAYVGRLGVLGAELARQISSVYGQSSDYAAFYVPTGAANNAPKRQALETLMKNIDVILPKLAAIEQGGKIAGTAMAASPQAQRSRARSDAPIVSPAQPAPPSETKASGEAKTGGEAKAGAIPGVIAAAQMPEIAEPSVSGMPPVSTMLPEEQPAPAIWEAVRGFIQGHRNAISTAHQPDEQSVAEYTEMIEADMARYQYTGAAESLDISPQKKRG